MKKIIYLLLIFAIPDLAFSQISSDQLLRLNNIANLTDLNAIASPQAGQLAFVVSENTTYEYNGAAWVSFGGESSTIDSLSIIIDDDNDTWIKVDNGTDYDKIEFSLFDTTYFCFDKKRIEVLNSKGSVFIGEHTGNKGEKNIAVGQDVLLSSTSSSFENIGIGFSALSELTSGFGNIGIGTNCLKYNNAYDNIAIGRYALTYEAIGIDNIAIGYSALLYGSGNNSNVAIGSFSLSNLNDSSADNNVAIGVESFDNSNKGNNNVGVGYRALENNQSDNNVAIGYESLNLNNTGSKNVSVGYMNLKNNESGSNNSSFGSHTMNSNIEGSSNSAFGYSAMNSCTSCDANSAFGYQALFNNKGGGNCAFGVNALHDNVDGYLNSAFGHNALLSCKGRNNTGIGHGAQVADSDSDNQVRIGNSNINYAAIQVSWSTSSDLHWKEKVRDLPYGMNLISKLRPVDYIRKNSSKQSREAGFIAQELVQVLEEVGFDDQGFLTQTDQGHYEVRYNDFIPIAIKGIQEQQEEIEQLKTKYNQLLERIEQLEKSKF